jgi:competence protein ComEA
MPSGRSAQTLEFEVKQAVQRDLASYMASSVLIFLLGISLTTAWLLGERPILAREAQAAPPAQSSSSERQAARPEFPAGQGREAVLRLCSRCHSPNIILANGQTRGGWEATITKMVTLGATGTDEDFTDIADYLTANFPPSKIPKLFVNKAKDQQLATLLGISLDDAKAIITYRNTIGGFKSIDDMKKTPNVDTKKIDAKKENLVF